MRAESNLANNVLVYNIYVVMFRDSGKNANPFIPPCI